MKEEHEKIIEHIISEFKKTDGKVFKEYYNSLFENYYTQLIVTKILTEEMKYIKEINNQFYILKTKGWAFTSFNEIEEKELEKEQRMLVEYEKTKIDLELAQKMLKEFPKTKQFARIGLFIAIVLALKELYILLNK